MTMRGTLLLVAGLALPPALSGCATGGNLFGTEECKVYGGTRIDATLVAEGLTAHSEAAQAPGVAHPVLVWEGCCGLVDMPLSFVADTVTLPITVPLALTRGGAGSPSDEPSPKPGKGSAAAQ
jgi:uncharacterized protein YceK